MNAWRLVETLSDIGKSGFYVTSMSLLELRRNVAMFYFDLFENCTRKSDTRFISGGTEVSFLILRVHATPGGDILFRIKSTERNVDCESPSNGYGGEYL
jgi:hypothetical protein